LSHAPLAFCFGVHNHQPIGNFEGVLRETTAQAYRPFFERLRARPEVRLTVHCTGSLLEWLREHEAPTFDLLGEVVAAGRVELLTGGFYEPILAILPDPDKRGQIERLTTFLSTHFGVRPRGMWLAERVWEPQLARILHDAGVEYVLVDDRHFALAGLEPDDLGGYYLTEDQGATLGVFPINERLRHLIPFADVDKSLEYLGERRGTLPAVTVMDDGEKFGGWPGTHRHVYEDGWLDRFLDRVLETPWLRLATFGDVVDAMPASGRVYLPTASYQEMGEWALPAEAGRALQEARRDLGQLEGGARLVGLLRGGFWRNFLVKYPEVAEFYWKMLRISAAIERSRAVRADDGRLLAAREALWRGQANDAYWHGVFGGCYLPHLRRAVKSALLEAEAQLMPGGGPVDVVVGDANGDGEDEVLVRTAALSITLNPSRGGTLSEIGARGRRHDLADVFGRRPEAYHRQLDHAASAMRSIHDPPAAKEPGLQRLLAYDRFRRVSLLDGLFGADGELDAVEPWAASYLALGTAAFTPTIERHGDTVEVTMEHRATEPAALRVTKRVSIRDAGVTVHYRLAERDGDGHARWAVQWNLALSAGEAPGRYLTVPGHPSLGSAGRLADASQVTLVDEWLGLQAQLAWRPAAELAWGPVETVSVSEAGFERIYQGLALLLAWPLGGDRVEMAATLTVSER
jgi:4-alpha-glucanotransferase